MPRPYFNLFPGGKIKCLTLSYDDGRDHDRRLVQIMNRHGIRGTFHLNSGNLGKDGYITASEIPALFAGHEVSAHSVHHPFLERVPLPRATQELLNDRRALEQICGYPVRGMSYPFGTYSQSVLDMLPAAGIEYSRTTQSHKSFTIPADFRTWHPTCHHNDCLELGEGFLGKAWGVRYGGCLFYVWGHSYEFANNNNWELIETFCAQMAGLPDVWYATNIEIVDYMNAARGLRFSADCSLVSNPSATDVWFTDQDGDKVIHAPAGKLTRLS